MGLWFHLPVNLTRAMPAGATRHARYASGAMDREEVLQAKLAPPLPIFINVGVWVKDLKSP